MGIMFLLNMLVVVLAFMNKLGRPADAGRVEKYLKCRLATAIGCTRIFFICFLTFIFLPNMCRAESSRYCVPGEWISLPCSFQLLEQNLFYCSYEAVCDMTFMQSVLDIFSDL